MMRCILTFLLSAAVFSAFAQFEVPMKETCEKLIKRKLLVVLFDTTNGNNKYNSLLKAEMKESWTYGEVEYATSMADMFHTLESSHRDNEYAVVEFIDKRYAADGWVTKEMANRYTNNNTKTIGTQEIFALSTFVMQIILPEQERPFLTVGVQNSTIGPSDIVFWTRQLSILTKAGLKQQNIFTYLENVERVKATTLYFNENDFSEDGKKYLAKNFKSPYKFLSQADYDKMVLAKEKVYYGKIVYSQEFQIFNAFVVIDGSTGRIALRTSQLPADCKQVYFGPPGGYGATVDMNRPGICAKWFVNSIYANNMQGKQHNTSLTRDLFHED